MQIGPDMSLEAFQSCVQRALRSWHRHEPENLLDFLALVRVRRTSSAGGQSPGSLRLKTNEVLLTALEELEKQNDLGAQLLRTRYLEKTPVLKATYKFHISRDRLMKVQREAIVQLAEILLRQELALREEEVRLFESHLPPPTYTELFGVQKTANRLAETLLSPSPPWIVALVGMGGLGKTALAHYLSRLVVHDFGPEQIRWIRVEAGQTVALNLPPERFFEALINELANQLGIPLAPPASRMQQTRYWLKRTPHLIVIDNLEAEEETAYLLEQLPGYAGPSRFLLTSRSLPSGQGSVYVHHLAELPFEAAAALLRHHSQVVGLGPLAISRPEDVEAVIAVTGGNPLALKLVVGLTALVPLSRVLSDLSHEPSRRVEEMYRHIYQAAWHSLSPDAQTLLLAMPLVADYGAEPDHLQEISQLPPPRFWTALQTLISRSLVEVQGNTTRRRYGLHPLTKTFLQSEIIHWPAFHEPSSPS